VRQRGHCREVSGAASVRSTRAGGTITITAKRLGLKSGQVSIIAKPLGLDPIAVAAGTCLCAGVLTIAMGVVSNYPFALAAGLGINAIVAYQLAAPKANGGLGMTPGAAMGVIVAEGVIITVLVGLGLREAIMRAVPLALKRSIGVGIGLFILFIGLSNGGLIAGSNSAYGSVPPVGLRPIVELSQWIFLVGLLITIVLYALRIKAALIISIVVTSVVAFVTGITSAPPQWRLRRRPCGSGWYACWPKTPFSARLASRIFRGVSWRTSGLLLVCHASFAMSRTERNCAGWSSLNVSRRCRSISMSSGQLNRNSQSPLTSVSVSPVIFCSE